MAIWCDANFYQITNNELYHTMILVFQNSLQKERSIEQHTEPEELCTTYHSLMVGQRIYEHQNE